MSSVKISQKKYKWALDFNTRTKQEKGQELHPPGYNPSIPVVQDPSKEADTTKLLDKKSWDLAIGPLRQVPMNLLIMYMAGNSISIFPIMMVGMLIVRPMKALFTIQTTFKMIKGERAALQKFIFFLGNIVNIALALYKCHSMGLLPSHASDWLAFVEPRIQMEYSGGGLAFL